MRLSAKPIKNYANINQFSFDTQWIIRQGEPNTLYFQLVDLEQDGLRYLPNDPSTNGVDVTFPAVNQTNTITRAAFQADPLDRSVWAVNITSSDKLYTGSVQMAVTNGSVIRKFSLLDALLVENVNNGGC